MASSSFRAVEGVPVDDMALLDGSRRSGRRVNVSASMAGEIGRVWDRSAG